MIGKQGKPKATDLMELLIEQLETAVQEVKLFKNDLAAVNQRVGKLLEHRFKLDTEKMNALNVKHLKDVGTVNVKVFNKFLSVFSSKSAALTEDLDAISKKDYDSEDDTKRNRRKIDAFAFGLVILMMILSVVLYVKNVDARNALKLMKTDVIQQETGFVKFLKEEKLEERYLNYINRN